MPRKRAHLIEEDQCVNAASSMRTPADAAWRFSSHKYRVANQNSVRMKRVDFGIRQGGKSPGTWPPNGHLYVRLADCCSPIFRKIHPGGAGLYASCVCVRGAQSCERERALEEAAAMAVAMSKTEPASMGRRAQMLIDGGWADSACGREIPVESPGNRQ